MLKNVSIFKFLIVVILFIKSSFVFANSDEPDEEIIPLSTPEQVYSFYKNDDLLIADVINPLSGNLSLSNTDLIAKGNQNISLTRYYNPPFIPEKFDKDRKRNEAMLYNYLRSNYEGWQIFPHLQLKIGRDLVFRITEPSGITFDYKIVNGKTLLQGDNFGINNIQGDYPSSKYDFRNLKIFNENDRQKIIVQAIDGTKRIYLPSNKSRTDFYLDKEVLPNGKIIKYNYDNYKLKSITSFDSKEKIVYSSIKIESDPKDLNQKYLSSNNNFCTYKNDERSYKINYKAKEGKGRVTLSGMLPRLLTSISSPYYRSEQISYDDKFLLDKYFSKDEVISFGYAIFGNEKPHYKINKVYLPVDQRVGQPVGQNDLFYPVYDISYNPPTAGKKDGKTTLKKSDGSSIIYEFSKKLLINRISFFDDKNVLRKQKIYKWFDNNWLESLEVLDGNSLLYKKSYKYDLVGNPIEAQFIGNLEGSSIQTYTIKRKFSDDGFNNLLYEENDDGLVSIYEYLPNTNLMLSKYTKDKATDKILIREFNEYDDANNLINNITDDGEDLNKNNLDNVHERKIIKYNLRQNQPFIHMTDSIEERYLDKGVEKLLKKLAFSYDKWGNVAKEDVYDANDNFVYSILKEYNERGDLLSETNPIGQKATFEYDQKGKLIKSTNFSNRLTTKNIYDANGRLKNSLEITKEGNHNKNYSYDVLDNLTSEEDLFGNTTFYNEYDSISKKPKRIIYPKNLLSNKQSSESITNFEYNTIGLKTSFIDANGNITKYKYNAYKDPIEIIHPNSSKEIFSYFKNGKLKSYLDQDGLLKEYTYDVLGRVVLKEYYFNDKKIGVERFKYNSFHLIEEIDLEGNPTKYIYDGAGRKISEDFQGRITEYVYDELSRLIKIIKQNSDNTLVINYTRDLLGRIIQETKTDLKGKELYKISYTYDADGNRNSITHFIGNNEGKESFEYDSFGRLTSYKDAQSNVTTTIYDESRLNELKQRVLEKTTVDPKKIKIIDIYNVFSKISNKKILNSKNDVISSIDFFYDPNSNLIEEQNHIFDGKILEKIIINKYSYNESNLISAQIRACGSGFDRTTQFLYSNSGKFNVKTLPDETELYYGYDELGNLKTIKSSDNKIDQLFQYNKLGYLVNAFDHIQNTEISRKLDSFGNVLKETFKNKATNNELFIEKTYDNFNRPLTIKFFNAGYVKHKYDPMYIRKIDRYSNYDETEYSHDFNEYDLNGNLLKENHIYNLGSTTYEKDLNNKIIRIQNPYINEKYEYEKNNLVKTIKENDAINYAYDELYQLKKETSKKYNHEYGYDSNFNRLSKDEKEAIINDLDELLQIGDTKLTYDKNGNVIQKQTSTETIDFIYDSLNRLIEAKKGNIDIKFQYDAIGRRLSKSVNDNSYLGYGSYFENYLYDGNVEIGAFKKSNENKNLKILSYFPNKTLAKAIAIEINGSIYLPIYDIQNNVIKLISTWGYTKEESYFTSFGEYPDPKSSFLSPWQYQNKRLDHETNLVCFGKRYYDPFLARWMSTDPAGFKDALNLYQYALNNPFKFVDPNGEFAFAIPLLMWGVELILPSLSTIVMPIVYGAITSAVAYTGYKLVEMANERGYSLSCHYVGQSAVNYYNYKYSDMYLKSNTEKEINNNPFEGPVDEDVFVGDAEGNIIPVDEGNWLVGSEDGKWIQEREPDGSKKGKDTGLRKDGGHPRGPKHPDPRAWEPHAHRPGISNPDGTPWLPIL